MLHNLFNRYKNMPIQVKASLWFLICSFMQKGISTITTPIFTRLLSTAQYGQYSVFNSWLSVITVFVTLHLSQGVYTQGLIKFEEKRNIFTSSLLGLTGVLLLGWTVIYLLFQEFWNQCFSLTTVQMLCMLVMIGATAVFNFWAAEQRVVLSYKRLVAVTVAVSVAKPVLGVLFVTLSEDKVTARILALVLVEVLAYTGLLVSQIRRGKCFFSKSFWKYALLFNLPLIPHYLSQTVLSSADRIMISSMVGSEQAGIYSLAYSISMIMLLFNTALSQTIGPWIYQKIKAEKAMEIHSVAYGALLLIAIVNLLSIALAPEIIAIFAPASYREAIWVIPPVAMSVYFLFSYDLFAKFEFYYDKTKFIMMASVFGAILNVVLNYLLIPLFGYIAAGYTTLFCYIVYAIGHFLFMNRVCDEELQHIRPYSLKILSILTFGFLGLGFYFLATYQHTVIRYVSLLILFGLLFFHRNRLINLIQGIVNSKKKR